MTAGTKPVRGGNPAWTLRRVTFGAIVAFERTNYTHPDLAAHVGQVVAVAPAVGDTNSPPHRVRVQIANERRRWVTLCEAYRLRPRPVPQEVSA